MNTTEKYTYLLIELQLHKKTTLKQRLILKTCSNPHKRTNKNSQSCHNIIKNKTHAKNTSIVCSAKYWNKPNQKSEKANYNQDPSISCQCSEDPHEEYRKMKKKKSALTHIRKTQKHENVLVARLSKGSFFFDASFT